MCETCNQLLSGLYIVADGHYHHQNCKSCSVCSKLVPVPDRLATATATSVTCGSCASGSSRNGAINQNQVGNPRQQSQRQEQNPVQQRNTQRLQSQSPTQQRNSQRAQTPTPRASGFAKAIPKNAPTSSFRCTSFSAPNATRNSRAMSVSDHRNSRTIPANVIEGSKTRSSRSDQGTTFMPSICGQQGFLSRRKGHGSWDRFWVVLNGQNLVFYAAPGGPQLEVFQISPLSDIQQNAAEKVIEIHNLGENSVAIKADTKPELDLWFECLLNAVD